MTQRKRRITVTIDPALLAAANRAVSAGRADSVSGWVSEALAARACQDSKLEALSEAVADYEAEFGEITTEEIAAQGRADRETASAVRGRSPGTGAA